MGWVTGNLPDESVSEVGSQRAVNAVTDALRRSFSELNRQHGEFQSNLNGCSGSQTDWISKVRLSAPFFRIHLDQSKICPDALNQIIQAVGSKLV